MIKHDAHAPELLASLMTLAWFVEAKDPYTGGHLWRVSRYCALIGPRAGLPPSVVASASLGGFLHDIGKIGVPDAILAKRGPLDEGEFALMREHPAIGLRMLAGHPMRDRVEDAVAMHHERPDGRGYPRALSRASIPKASLLVGACDAFDAMTSDRPYRKAMPTSRALAILDEGRDTQFSGDIVEAFLATPIEELDAIRAHSDDGIPLHACPSCGLTVIQASDATAGSRTACRSCEAVFEFELDPDGLIRAWPIGRTATPGEFPILPDHAQIRRVINQHVKALLDV
jgi:response regulator RpfG family c-di-GMP phosphodiesterase